MNIIEVKTEKRNNAESPAFWLKPSAFRFLKLMT